MRQSERRGIHNHLLSDVLGLERRAGDHFPANAVGAQRTPSTVFVPLDCHKGITLPDSP